MSRTVGTRLRRPKTTPVFTSYWQFANERQRIFYRRLRNEPPPWTCDGILQGHRFTNAFRASDRESQYLIGTVIGDDHRGPADTFFRVVLFRFFNKASTWELLKKKFGEPAAGTFDVVEYNDVLEAALTKGMRLFSAAYIMPSRGRGLSAPRKHSNLLSVLHRMLDDEVPERIFEMTSERAFRVLRSYPMMGDFLAYQYVTDLGYSKLAQFTEAEFVAAGPGARDGIKKCFSDTDGLSDADVIKWVFDNQEALAKDAGVSSPDLFGRRLQLIDCQNLFCEVDKYARVAHPEFQGRSGRTQIKQKFSSESRAALPPPSYPANWRLDGAISRFFEEHHGA